MAVDDPRTRVARAAKIERARLRDALPTLALHREILLEGKAFVTAPDEFTVTIEDREREIRVLGDADNSCFLVARLPEVRVAGFLTVNGGRLARTRHVARIEMVVGARWRRQGIGRALLSAGVALARDSGVLRKLSLAVMADNVAAIELYRSFGFVEEGRRSGEYREAEGTLRDDLLMALHLPEAA